MDHIPDFASADAAGETSAKLIRRHITAPLCFDIKVALDDDGALLTLAAQRMPSMADDQVQEITRAVVYIMAVSDVADRQGESVFVALAAIPTGPAFAVERSIVTEILAVAAIRSGRHPLATVSAEGRA